MELLTYDKSPFIEPLQGFQEELKQALWKDPDARKALIERISETLWDEHERLTYSGFSLMSWLVRHLGDGNLLYHTVHADFVAILKGVERWEEHLRLAQEFLNANRDHLETIFNDSMTCGKTRAQAYRAIRARLDPAGPDTLLSRTRVLNAAVEGLVTWTEMRRGDQEEAARVQFEDLFRYLKNEVGHKEKILKALHWVVPPKAINDNQPTVEESVKALVEQLLGVIFIRYTPSFNGMYYHYVGSDMVPIRVKAYYRESIEIPFKSGTVGYLPDKRIRSSIADAPSLVLDRLYADLRGIMSSEDSMLGNRSWIGSPLIAEKFLGVFIVNFPLDSIFSAGSHDPEQDPVGRFLTRYRNDKLPVLRAKLQEASNKEMSDALRELRGKVQADDWGLDHLNERDYWNRILSIIMPAGRRGAKQNEYFGFSMATVWHRGISARGEPHRTLQVASLLETALTQNFEPACSRWASVLPRWMSGGEYRMNQYRERIFEGPTGVAPSIVWDHRFDNSKPLDSCIAALWADFDAMKNNEQIAQHEIVEAAHHTLHKWIGDDPQQRIVDLLVPIFEPASRYTDSTQQSAAASRNASPSDDSEKGPGKKLAAIIRINCYDRKGSSPKNSKTLKLVRDTIQQHYPSFQKLASPVSLCRNIASEHSHSALLDIVVSDFEDVWWSMACKYLLGSDHIDEGFLATSAAIALDTCLGVARNRETYKPAASGVISSHLPFAADDELQDAIRSLKELRLEIKPLIKEHGSCIFAMSAWPCRVRFRLADVPETHSGEIETSPTRLKLTEKFDAAHAFLNPVENRVFGKLLTILERLAATGALNEIKQDGRIRLPLKSPLGAALPEPTSCGGGRIYVSTMLAKLPNGDNRTNPGFAYLHCAAESGDEERRWNTVFSDESQSPFNGDGSVNPVRRGDRYLSARWTQTRAFENADWVCAHGDIGKFLFSEALEHERLMPLSGLQTETASLSEKAVDIDIGYIDHSSSIKLASMQSIDWSKTELRLIAGDLVQARYLLRIPLFSESLPKPPWQIGEIHFYSLFQDPSYGKEDEATLWEYLKDLSPTILEYQNKINGKCSRLFPREEKVADCRRKLHPFESAPDEFSYGPESKFPETAAHVFTHYAYMGELVTEGDSEAEKLLFRGLHSLLKSAVLDMPEKKMIRTTVLLAPMPGLKSEMEIMMKMDIMKKSVERFLDELVMDLSFDICDRTEPKKTAEYRLQCIRCMRVLRNQPNHVFVVTSDGKMIGAWKRVKDGRPAFFKDTVQTHYANLALLSQRSGGIVYHLPGDGRIIVLARGFVIAEYTARGWVPRDIRNFVEKAFQSKQLEGLRIDERDIGRALSAAIYASDCGIGCGFIFARTWGGMLEGDTLDGFHLTRHKHIRDIAPDMLAGFASDDGNVLVSNEGIIHKIAAFLNPGRSKNNKDPTGDLKLKWGMRHRSACNFLRSTKGIGILVSSTGRMTVLDSDHAAGSGDGIVAECPDEQQGPQDTGK